MTTGTTPLKAGKSAPFRLVTVLGEDSEFVGSRR